MTTFRNPANDFTQTVNGTTAFLGCLFFGPLFFVSKNAWKHAVISAFAAPMTFGLSWIIYPFFAHRLIEHAFLERGWQVVDDGWTPPSGGDDESDAESVWQPDPLYSEELTLEQAEWVVNREDELCLPRLTKICPEIARVLAQHAGKSLRLDGLKSLTPAEAEALLQYRGHLTLNGLEELPEQAAAVLAQQWSHRHLEISLPSEIWKEIGRECDLPEDTHSIETLTVMQAKALANSRFNCELPGLKTLSAEIAEALAAKEGWLNLSGLTTLSDEAAELLAEHTEILTLDGLTTLSEKAARALSGYKGDSLSLNGLNTLSPSVSEMLRTNPRISLPKKFQA